MDFELPSGCRYAVIGDPVAHSKSPEMQNAAFAFHRLGECYAKIRIKPEELAAFCAFARQNLAGFNITVPHKEAMLRLIDAADQSAMAAGGVNTVKIQDGKLYGFSTDGFGIENALREAFSWNIRGGGALFIGAGGAARAAAGHFALNGLERLFIVNRTLEKAQKIAAEAKRLNDSLTVSVSGDAADFIGETDLVIQFTSLGLKSEDAAPFDFNLLNSSHMIYDTIYHKTALQKFCAQHRIRFADGRTMLLHQGAKSFELWTGLDAPLEIMRRTLDHAIGGQI